MLDYKKNRKKILANLIFSPLVPFIIPFVKFPTLIDGAKSQLYDPQKHISSGQNRPKIRFPDDSEQGQRYG